MAGSVMSDPLGRSGGRRWRRRGHGARCRSAARHPTKTPSASPSAVKALSIRACVGAERLDVAAVPGPLPVTTFCLPCARAGSADPHAAGERVVGRPGTHRLVAAPERLHVRRCPAVRPGRRSRRCRRRPGRRADEHAAREAVEGQEDRSRRPSAPPNTLTCRRRGPARRR